MRLTKRLQQLVSEQDVEFEAQKDVVMRSDGDSQATSSDSDMDSE
jgi:hypothetical protein